MSESEHPSSDSAEPTQLARRAGTVAAFTLGSRVLGYVRDAVLANVFGAGIALDAFIAAQTIPNVLRRLVAEGTLMIAYVPLLAAEKTDGGLPAMRRFSGAVLGVLLPILAVLVGLGMLFPEMWVTLFASGFDEPRAELAAQLTRVMMPFLFFISLVALAGGALNTVGVFGPPAAAPILLNVCIISAVTALAGRLETPVNAAAYGVVVGGVAQLGLQLPFLHRRGLLPRPRLDLRHPALKTLGRRMLPAVFGVGVYQLNMIIIRQIASYLPQGQLSAYFIASRLEEFALGVFAVSISVAALPTLSEHAARKDAAALFDTFERALRATTFITVPAMAGLFVFATPIVGTLFRHGRFDAEAAQLTAQLVQVMAFALVPIGAVRVIVPTYFSIGDTRTPVVASTASMLTTAGLGFALGRQFEIFGLTLATVVAATVQAFLLSIWLGRRIRDVVGRDSASGRVGGLVVHAIRCLGAVVPGTLVGAWLAGQRAWFTGGNLGNAIVLTALGGILIGAYFLVARLLGLTEVGLILQFLLRRIRR